MSDEPRRPAGTAPQPAASVLVVEDEEPSRVFVVSALEREGYDVRSASNGVEAREILAHTDVDLVVLDLGLPDESGLDLLTSLRERQDPAVLIMTGRDSLGDRVLGLDTGADDYLVKPVEVPELRARVRALIRRTRSTDQCLTYGSLRIDLRAREVHVKDTQVDLTRKEFELLAFLASHPRVAFDRDDLLREVWRSAPEYQTTATVTEHIRRIREKIKDDAENPRWIVAIHGVGYRFEPDSDHLEDSSG